MSLKDENDLIFQELSENSDLVKYVTFMARKSDKKTGQPELSDSEVLELYYEQLSSLTSFLNYRLIGKPLKKKRDTPDLDFFSSIFGVQKTIYHMLIFIEDAIFDILQENQQKNIDFVTKIILFLEKHRPYGSSIILYVDDSRLFFDIRTVPDKVINLKKLYNKKMQKLTLLCPPLVNLNAIKLELKGIIDSVTGTIDVNNSYFPETYLQSSFEHLITQKSLPFSDTISSIIESFSSVSPDEFTEGIFTLCSDIIQTLNLTQKYSDSAVSFLLYRFFFDAVYSENKFLNCNKINANPFPLMSDATAEEIQIPLDFSPPGTNLKSKPRDIFLKDPYFSKAVEKINEMVFFCNPLDILAVVMETISIIEKAASTYDTKNTLVFPFEVTFGLFLGVVLSSSVFCDITNIAKFVDLYTPQSGMCPSFEYARAKLIAAATELEEMELSKCGF